MGRKVKNRVTGSNLKEHYRSAGLSSGGMVHQLYRDAVIYDVWGRKLALRQTSNNAGCLWFSVRRWLEKHPEAGVLVEKPWPTTLEDIMSWVKERRSLYEDLDDAQRKDFAAAACKLTEDLYLKATKFTYRGMRRLRSCGI
jgi:hypothetical protein